MGFGRNSGETWRGLRGKMAERRAALRGRRRGYRRHGLLLTVLAATFALGLILGSGISLLLAPSAPRQAELLPLERQESPDVVPRAAPERDESYSAPVVAAVTEDVSPEATPRDKEAHLSPVAHPPDFTGEEDFAAMAPELEPASEGQPEGGPATLAPPSLTLNVGSAPTETSTAPASEPGETGMPEKPVLAPKPRLVLNAPLPEAVMVPKATEAAKTPEAADAPEIAPPRESAPALAERSRAEETPAWRRNAVQLSRLPSGPAVAIVIDDLGLNRPGANRSIALPPPLTLAMMTYADGLPRLAVRARAAGHELIVHMPMQPIDAEYNAGIKVLTVDLDREQLLERLNWGLGRFDGYVGINNHMGSRFTMDPAGMETVMAELKRRGLMFLDSKTVGGSLGVEAARRAGVPVVARDIFIDHEQEPGYIRRQLRALEDLAQQRGYAIGIGHPHAMTLDELERWIPEARARGVSFVPISAILALQERSLAAHSGERSAEVN